MKFEDLSNYQQKYAKFITMFYVDNSWIVDIDDYGIFESIEKYYVGLMLRMHQAYCDNFNKLSDNLKHKAYKICVDGNMKVMSFQKVPSENSKLSKFTISKTCDFDIIPVCFDLEEFLKGFPE